MTQAPDPRRDDALDDIEETDDGPKATGRRAAHRVRRCVATMERRSPEGMLRFVLSPDGLLTPDLDARLPGRGAWVMAGRDHLETAIRKGAFSRAFKTQAKTPPDLVDRVHGLLVRRALDGLGLGRRAGQVLAGFDQVREHLRAERPACLIEASDGAADGRAKVLGLARAVHQHGEESRIQLIACFTAAELGMALGRERVIHACVKRGRFADAWLADIARLSGFRRLWPEDWTTASQASPDPTAAEAPAAAPIHGGET
jgi:uncharacterized protein